MLDEEINSSIDVTSSKCLPGGVGFNSMAEPCSKYLPWGDRLSSTSYLIIFNTLAPKWGILVQKSINKVDYVSPGDGYRL